MITETEREKYSQRLTEWLRMPKAPRPQDPDEFRERVLGVLSYSEERDRNKRQCSEALTTALKHTQKAIEALSKAHDKGASSGQTRHLLALLKTAYSEAGEPKEKAEIHKSYYDSASDTWIDSVLTATQKKARSPRARLIFDLETLWFSEFGERPKKHDHEPEFYIFAGHLLGLDPNSVKTQRGRIVPESDRYR